uniref:ATP-binding cassette sub-family B member 9 n=1 Tax=Syphacia muris TaxID=451379 RepID=A0A0N5AMH6_9BILA
MKNRLAILILVSYVACDILLTLIAFGLYSPDIKFNLGQVYEHVHWINYSYLSHPSEFLVFVCIRITIILIGIFLRLNCGGRYMHNLFLPILGFFIFTWTVTLIKLLAFAEYSTQLTYIGVWLSIVWNIAATALLFPLWYLVICSSFLIKYDTVTTDILLQTSVETKSGVEQQSAIKNLGTAEHVIKLLTYCRQQWLWFSTGFLFLLIYSLARVFIPNYNGEVISNIYDRNGLSALTNSVFKICGLSLISTVFGGLRAGCFEYAAALVNRQIRTDFFKSVVKQEIGFFDATKTGEIVSRLSADCQSMSHIVATNINLFLRNGVMLIGGLVFMFTLSWRLTLASFIFVPLIGYITKLYGAYYDRLSERTQASIAKANQVAEEVFSTIRTVRSFACEEREIHRFRQYLNKTLSYNRRASLGYMGYMWTNELCDNIILVGILFYGGHLVLSGKLASENFIKLLLYQLQLGENLYNLGVFFTGIMESVGASRKVFEYMLRKPNEYQGGTSKMLGLGEIRFDSVCFAYPSRPGIGVLENVSFAIKPGETVALVGPSGSGKTSIVSLIEHFYEATSGDIYIDDVSIKNFDHEFLHQKIAMVAQEPVLYSGSVRDNILYGCESATEEDMIKAAKDANVHDFILETEKGYDTECGEKGVQMSGGQKQRIAIARALVRNPAILILDEATSALDAESEHLVQEAINRCAVNRTVIIIAHRLSTVEEADRIIVISNGHVAQVCCCTWSPTFIAAELLMDYFSKVAIVIC